jgi:hypothetical protein
MRNGTAGLAINSICYFFKTAALKIDVDETWRAHCVAIPAEPAAFCSGTAGVPLQTGRLFVVSGAPNPFRTHMDISFSLPKAGNVVVEVFGADGRRVQVLQNGEMAAGPHTVTWNVDRATPSGMYFYRVRSNAGASSGKVIRVD